MDKLKCWERKRSQAWTCLPKGHVSFAGELRLKGAGRCTANIREMTRNTFLSGKGTIIKLMIISPEPRIHIHSWFSHTNTHSSMRTSMFTSMLPQAKHSPEGFSKQFPTRVVQGWSFFHLLWEQLLLAITSDMIWKYIDPSLIHYEYSHRNIKTVCMHLCTVMHTKYALGCLVMLIPTKG